jgi:hypothetical protein
MDILAPVDCPRMPMLWVPTPWILGSCFFAACRDVPEAVISLLNDDPVASASQIQSKPVNGQKSKQLAPDFIVSYQSGVFDALTQTWTFKNGVVATYDVTTVRCDLLVVHIAPGEERAEATGSVYLDDPAGTATADSMTFSWLKGAQAGAAMNVMIHIADVMLRASRAELKPDRWDLFDVAASSCRENPPLFELHAAHIVIRPGRNGVIRKPVLWILGHPLIPVPDQTLNFDSRTQGLQYPSLNYHAGQGIGVAFKEAALLSPTTNLAVNYGAIHGALPGYSGVVTTSLLPDAKNTSISTPSSDFSERFRFGYLENIEVVSADDEARFLRTARDSFSVASAWNSSISDRPDLIPFTMPLEGIYEIGGGNRSFGFLGQARMQMIQEYRENFHERLVLEGAAGIAPQLVLPKLSAIARLDSSIFVGNDYGWVRGIAGLVYSPLRQLSVSAGGFASAESGHPLYSIDPLYAADGFVFRADLNLGPTRLSYLSKWDPNLGWFDREYTVRQAVGCLEPFLVVREYPRSYDLGIRLRLDEFYDVLRRRHFENEAPPKVVISGG